MTASIDELADTCAKCGGQKEKGGSSRKRVGEIGGPKALPTALGAGARGVAGSRESGILRACLCADVGFGFITRTASRDFDRTPR